MKHHLDIEIKSQTEHPKEIYQLVESQLMNIGFVNSLHNNHNAISKVLFKEGFVFLYHQDSKFAKSRDIKDCDEGYQTWSNEFYIWFKLYFPYFNRSKNSGKYF